MPNIEIRGYTKHRAQALRATINEVMHTLMMEDIAVTSIIPMIVAACDGKAKSMPYIRICSTNKKQIHRIINALKEAGLEEDVEYLKITGFIPALKMKRPKS
jgi:hypothetical protein